MGIYWVYFRDRDNQLKLSVKAETKDKATKIGISKAQKCSLQNWKHEDTQACR